MRHRTPVSFAFDVESTVETTVLSTVQSSDFYRTRPGRVTSVSWHVSRFLPLEKRNCPRLLPRDPHIPMTEIIYSEPISCNTHSMVGHSNNDDTMLSVSRHLSS